MTGRLKSETGFVGFFDILGYGSLLESGLTEITYKVIEILAKLAHPEGVWREKIGEHLGINPGLVPDLDWELAQITPLVVSDSILLRSAYDEGREKAKRTSQAATFIMAASVFQRAMFIEGLPVRGAIAFGDFVFRENVFAGKPIFDAYKLGGKLNLAACAVHKSAEDEFNNLVAADSSYRSFLNADKILVRYATPLKEPLKQYAEMLLLNLAWPTLGNYGSLKGVELRRHVYDKFLAHNKQLAPDAITKADNTEGFFRFLESRFPHFFDR